jgi:diaminohydroxyphosphoribosylaminopyrimidine deaminase / 5-amino-6-(5-phosphoribosylamino)uracil reductase
MSTARINLSHPSHLASASDDDVAMRRALLLARCGQPAPNPHVGALLVRAGSIVGSGFHARAGCPHAEVIALRQAGERARGGSLYVTLEPCNHHGRTPPCVDALLKAGVTRVVIGCLDPNPLVSGGGAVQLAEAGVVVDFGPWQEEARALIADWVATLPSRALR